MNRALVALILGAVAVVISLVAIGISAAAAAASKTASSFDSITAVSGTFQTSLTSPEITQLKAASCMWSTWMQTMGFVQLKPELGPCQAQMAFNSLYTYRLWTTFCGPSSPKFWSVEIVPSAFPSFTNGPGYYTLCDPFGLCINHTCEYTGITLENFIPTLPVRSTTETLSIAQNAFIQLTTTANTTTDLTGDAWTLGDNALTWFSKVPVPISGQFIWRLENGFKLHLFTSIT